MAAAAVTSCLATLPAKFKGLSLNTTTTTTAAVSASTCPASNITTTFYAPLSFSSTLSPSVFCKGSLSMRMVQRRPPIGISIVCEAAPKKKADSAVKRARQADKRRIYNKSRKSEIRTRMKKLNEKLADCFQVLEALDELRKKPDAQREEVFPIEKLIADAYSVIDKAVKVGTMHRNTGARRKSRLARNKKAVEIHHGWYSPTAAAS